MKIAVISFSGNVGKTTIARHLLAPRIAGARVVSIESINSGESRDTVIRGCEFADLHEYLQVVDSVIVDIGASNVEALLMLMRRFRGSHEDFDYFFVPTVPNLKQQKDTVATVAELARLGVPGDKVRLVFNMIEDESDLERTFAPLLAFLRESRLTAASLDCRLGSNEIYGRIQGTDQDLAAIVADPVDYKAQIAAADDRSRKLALAQCLATRRLASGVLPELDACFAALNIGTETSLTLTTPSLH